MSLDGLAGLGIHEGAAAGREHLWTRAQKALDDAALAVAEVGLAMVGEDLGDAFSRRLLDFLVGVDEGEPERAR